MSLSRRYLLAAAGASVSSLALAGSVVASRLSEGPDAAGGFDLQRFLDTAGPRAVADYHLNELTKALQALHGGGWKGMIHTEGKFALVILDPNLPDVAAVDFTHR